MTITSRNSQTYLGMNLNIKKKMVYMEMEDFLKDCLNDFPEDITIARGWNTLYKKSNKISSGLGLLDHQREEIFHSIVQKLLYVSKHSRLDLQLTVGFLCTQVRFPTYDNWKKLKQLLQYIFGTLKPPQILFLNSFKQTKKFFQTNEYMHRRITCMSWQHARSNGGMHQHRKQFTTCLIIKTVH